jgi:hypothetical protein
MESPKPAVYELLKYIFKIKTTTNEPADVITNETDQRLTFEKLDNVWLQY